jgi:hypothetical protein
VWHGQVHHTDNLYRSTDPAGVYAASSPFKLSGHVEVISYPPILVEIRCTGTSWNVRLPDGRTVIRRSGQEVSSFVGEPGSQVMMETIKWTGRTVFDNKATCDALAK